MAVRWQERVPDRLMLRAHRMSRSYTACMLPCALLSMGRIACSARHCDSTWKAVSKCSQGSGWQPGTASRAMASLYAPYMPWKATTGAEDDGSFLPCVPFRFDPGPSGRSTAQHGTEGQKDYL